MLQDKDIEFVITVPEEFSTELCVKTNARQTVAVLIDIFLSAKQYVVLSSPFLQDFDVINPNLERAIRTALDRGVSLRIISTQNSLEKLNLSKFGKNVKVYQPRRNAENSAILGSHAKFCLADGKVVYIGSANITVPGLNDHIEMGILGGIDLAKKVELFWDFLSKYDFLSEVSETRTG